jgi:putative NADPH-quinone reductase
MPALLKAFLEQVFRPGFAFGPAADGTMPRKRLGGRSARVVVTMGMPVFVYRWYFRAHSLKSLERNVLKFCGIKSVRETLFGMVEAASGAKRAKWLSRMRELGSQGR